MPMSMSISVREYVCRLQRVLQTHLLAAHGIAHAPSEHTGVFVDAGADAAIKVGSIGVQVRHRLTTHGFALNVTRAPLAWFDRIVACGLADVKAGAIAGRSTRVQEATDAGAAAGVRGEVAGVVDVFGRVMGREMVRLDVSEGDEVTAEIVRLEESAREMQRRTPAPLKPSLS
ncbi:hypothetical protein EW145_g7911 [Phellinidium pouzarii]|uniref:BPL/LPL catalytic domain-containing protein n=1 Tax=Phellinidium pouzarii TaxID=167371 RepID=A0A4S4KCC6_9AGAM|nr:hypothetical protein EW145_g7911 [Phellinidium pouzarii]